MITDEKHIDDEAARTGIARTNLILIVAKSAVIRYIATHPDYKEDFVLKGGTLLYHVYRSPRASYKDADYGLANQLKQHSLSVDDVERMLTINEAGIDVNPKAAQWSTRNDIIAATGIAFTIDNITMPSRREDKRVGKMTFTIAIRETERIDEPDRPLWYHDPMLLGESSFRINGLTLNELAAEKILGWVLKGQAKHVVDLAILARDHENDLTLDRVGGLLEKKIASESKSEVTRHIYLRTGLSSVRQLASHFQGRAAEERLETDWQENPLDNFSLLEDERQRPDTVGDLANVKSQISRVWLPFLTGL